VLAAGARLMIADHEGAIRMARAELAKGEKPSAARNQATEIRTLNGWLEPWCAVPCGGGVPKS
jgi:uncharacterized protein (DUF305 family)